MTATASIATLAGRFRQSREMAAAGPTVRRMRRARWLGYATIENLGNIAFYALLAAAAIVTVQQLLLYANNIKVSNQIDTLQSAVRTLYSGQAGYSGLDNTVLRNNNAVPPDLIDPASATGIMSAFGAVTINVDPADSSQFQIQLAGVTAAICSRLVRNRSGGAQFAGLISVSMNGGAAITNFPVSAAQSGTGCSVSTSAGNTIQWTYK